MMRDLEMHIAGRPHHELAAGRHRDGRDRLRALAGRKPGRITGGRPV